MRTLPDGIQRAFRLALRRPRIEQDVDDEVRFHLEMRASELVARGWSPDAALAEAQRRFGNTHQWRQAMTAVDRERVAHETRTQSFEDLLQDLRFAVRSLRRAPLFTPLAVLTLALGIGANAAVFGVVKSVLLDPLPYADADRVVRIFGRRLDGSVERSPISAGVVTEIRARQQSFTSVATFLSTTVDGVYAMDEEPRLVKLLRTEPALFSTLGVRAALGRTLQDEDAQGDTAFNVVLTHTAWQRLFSGDPGIVGRTMRVNDITRTIVGVMPADFVGPVAGADVYMPFGIRNMLRTPVDAWMRKNLGIMARLKPGASAEAAGREVSAIVAEVAKAQEGQRGSGVATLSVREAFAGDTRTPLLVLMASAALVLLITCANLAGALLSRTISRRKEFAIRAALGAGRGRLVRQLLTESTLLALLGGVTGIAFAMAGLAVLRGVAANALPPYADLSLDTGALVVTTVVALLTGLAFGAAPAVSVGQSDPQSAMREETRGASESRRSRTLRGLLVTGQIALCVSLLAGAGLLVRSLAAMMATPIGFRGDNVLVASVFLPQARFRTGESRVQFNTTFTERLRAIPGVVSVGTGSGIPTRITAKNGFTVEGTTVSPTEGQPGAVYMDVGDEYFATMGIPVRQGRTFSAEERIGGPLGIIISEGLARQYVPNGSAVGKRIWLGPSTDEPAFTVVGVVGDVRNDPARAEPEPVLYLSNRQFPWNGPTFFVRTTGDPNALIPAMRQALAELDPALPLHDITTMPTVLTEGFAGRRLPVVLMTAFGALALLLASVGVYAMFAAMAAAREREFAVRMALGSSRGAIAALVLRQGGSWMLLGLVVGAFGVVAITRTLRSLLYGVGQFDPIALGVAVLLLVLCGAIALLVPVRKATHADPISILR